MVLDGLHRRPVLEITVAFLVVLVLAQALIGALSLSALYRLNAETTADRAEVEVRQLAATIENGLRLGKPLGQFFGLSALLDQQLTASRDAQGVMVMLNDGQVVAARGEALPESLALARASVTPSAALPGGSLVQRPNGTVVIMNKQRITVAVPLVTAASAIQGVAVLAVKPDAVGARRFILRNFAVLFGVTLIVGLGLAAFFKYLVPPARLVLGGRTRFVLPLVALMLAQGLYAAYTIHTFRQASLQVTRDNVQMLAQGLQRDLNRVLNYGVTIDHLRGVEAPLSRLAATFPVISSIELVDASGHVLNRANARGALPVGQSAAASGELVVSLPLGAGPLNSNSGQLIMRLADDVIAAGVRARVIDAATVVVVALVAAFEMILLLTLLLHWPRHGNSDGAEIGRIGRPVMFSFLFAWALPLSFLPLYARSLPDGGVVLPPNLLLALPISVEMGCGLLTALLAGGLTDRRGWQVPVLAGLAVCGLGFAACAVAPDLIWFTAARGLVGLGYGLTWMGLQGFIVTRSAPAFRGANVSNVVAGLFAGHLAGAAVGAMLMEQLGFRTVFTVGVVMLAVPLSGVLVLMRPFMVRPAARVANATSPRLVHVSLASTLRLLCTRDFGLLLLGSVIPFSIAQVGLLSFALPLYLEAEGAAASSIGRVLMIYGLCVIYLGPLMGRLADRSRVKKRWIVVGGLIGSFGLLSLYFNSGMAAAAFAVLSLALASCLAGASQASYMLALPDVQRYGAAGATSVMRAADKLGQMGGPLVVGLMFGSVGMGAGLAVTGLIYLVATLIFLLFAPANSSVTPMTPAPVPSSR
jgi:predicted MFS family arabinose efflux permease